MQGAELSEGATKPPAAIEMPREKSEPFQRTSQSQNSALVKRGALGKFGQRERNIARAKTKQDRERPVYGRDAALALLATTKGALNPTVLSDRTLF